MWENFIIYDQPLFSRIICASGVCQNMLLWLLISLECTNLFTWNKSWSILVLYFSCPDLEKGFDDYSVVCNQTHLKQKKECNTLFVIRLQILFNRYCLVRYIYTRIWKHTKRGKKGRKQLLLTYETTLSHQYLIIGSDSI